jgi:hypothetical protein
MSFIGDLQDVIRETLTIKRPRALSARLCFTNLLFFAISGLLGLAFLASLF